MAKGRDITAVDLGVQASVGAQPASEELSLDQAEKIFIQKVLARHGGDVRKAADQLGDEPERPLPAAATLRTLTARQSRGRAGSRNNAKG